MIFMYLSTALLITGLHASGNNDIMRKFCTRFKINGDESCSLLFNIFKENIIKMKDYEEILEKARFLQQFDMKFSKIRFIESETEKNESPMDRFERTNGSAFYTTAGELHLLTEEIKRLIAPIEAFLTTLMDNKAFEKAVGSTMDLVAVKTMRQYFKVFILDFGNLEHCRNELSFYRFFITSFITNKNIVEEYKKKRINKELDDDDSNTVKYLKVAFLFLAIMFAAFCLLTVIVVICNRLMRKRRPLQE
ncbi:hypothetical protein VCUG_02575 [Vavraia culicis subsp. floridensis]|uniref:FH2 domain-containing protein n=1 Tax=Vavraia culicis (isolate floridensis) TaxID=948595 RepID=L2GRN5_VAVCU|nr:uncharacterized protein VCUG_02575 [Vavraia culicis subsp. floridensis]ELA45933.1 hypothetical protein VCUG_02575 [Vavraia culicis subsp. floridensis]